MFKPSIFYWNQRNCIQEVKDDIVCLCDEGLYSLIHETQVLSKQIDIFSLQHDKLLYADSEEHLFIKSQDREQEIIYRSGNYGGYTDFIEDIQLSYVLRRKEVVELDLELLCAAQFYDIGCYFNAFSVLKNNRVIVATDNFILQIDFKSMRTESIEKVHHRVSELLQSEKYLFIGYYDGLFEIIDAKMLKLVCEFEVKDIESAVPIGHIVVFEDYVYFSCHWDKLFRISLCTYEAKYYSNLGSIYGFVVSDINQLVVSSSKGILIINFLKSWQ